MFVVLFLIVSIIVLVLFFFNKLRVTHINANSLLNWVKWYALFLLVYFILSSNSYYVKPTDPMLLEIINLSVLVLISFGMILYVNQYAMDKIKERKLQEMAIAYALMENEMRQKESELDPNSIRK
ncbi:MAG: hypothetical protein ACRCST_08415 [Turicibacter sp.]